MKTFPTTSDWLFPLVFLALWIWGAQFYGYDHCAGRDGFDSCAWAEAQDQEILDALKRDLGPQQ